MMFSICAAPTSISECDHKGVLEHVVVEVAVGGKSHDSTPTDRQRVEGLSGCIFPHLYNKQKKCLNVILLTLFRFYHGVKYLHIQDFCQIGLGTNVEFYPVSGAL